MKILGIHDGHNSGATLLIDGEIVAAVCEERLTRNKNEVGYPRLSIDEVINIAGIASDALDQVVYASNFMHSMDHLSKANIWYRAGKEDQQRDAKREKTYLKAVFDVRKQERIQQAVKHLGVSPENVSFVEHHLAHGAAAYYGAPFELDEPVLILTCDGAGDGVSASVSIGNGTKIERIAETKRKASLGKVYSRVTYALGLTPWEHEYKVMGLAPYAEQKYAEEIRDILKEHLTLSEDGLSFELVTDLESSYIYYFLRDRFECKRFDAISGGVQMFTEELLREWVLRVVEHTGIRKVVCGGGVFMNVKANKFIGELDCVDELFVFPSCGDESLSFGAVWLEYARLAGEAAGKARTPLEHLYLGREFSDTEIDTAIKQAIGTSGCTYQHYDAINPTVAKLLAENHIVARFSGRMEWGARALGNRSILANPREWPNVEKINAMIKKRDFWMPFAPSMLAEESDRFLVNPKGFKSPYMMLAYDTNPESSQEIGAAVHPRDKTARAQFVKRDTNLGYWELIKAFGDETGTYCVLNTSFNLHGYPLINTPAEALDVFLNSGLDYLALGDYLVAKPELELPEDKK
ncbi:MAG: carbamoyltransferase C-terminal domain-containing protein [Rickettsiales bacterium]|nr:carbamoyltransferase C-terminal domain-containing protein [Rickettsiales bacterium]